MTRCCGLLWAVVFAASCAVSARTRHISPDGTGDAPTIQAGIDSAAAGDTLILLNGSFTGEGNYNISWNGKAVAVISEGGDPDLCIIDAANQGRGVVFRSGEGPASILGGVTIQYCSKYAGSYGGGILCCGTSPTIRNVVLALNNASGGGGLACDSAACPVLNGVTFIGNTAYGFGGGGMWCGGGSSPTLTNIKFIGNDAGYYGVGGGLSCTQGSCPSLTDVTFLEDYGDLRGGGIYCEDSSPTLTDVVFEGNASACSSPPFPGGAGMSCYRSSPSLANCLFVGNWTAYGGGIECADGSDASLTNVTVYGNSGSYAGGIYCEDSSPELTNTIITSSTLGPAVYCYGASNPAFTCCNIHDNSGGDWVGCITDWFGIYGNFSQDPLFCDPGGASPDFRLCDKSPCSEGNHPDAYPCGLIGAYGIGCVCDSNATKPTLWSTIKAIYRKDESSHQ